MPKGIAITKVIELIAGIIIVAVLIALYIDNVFAICNSPDSPYCHFPISEKDRFIAYSTCALAKCSTGCDSTQVKALCLEGSADGSCKTWCKDTCQQNDKGSECGQKYALQFDVQGSVLLNSGDFQTYAHWVCGAFDYNIPFVTFSGNKNFCLMNANCVDPHAAIYGQTPLMTATGLQCGQTTSANVAGFKLDFPIFTSASVPESYADTHCSTSSISNGAQIRKLDSCTFISDDPTAPKKITYELWADKRGFIGCSFLQICPTTGTQQTTTSTPVIQTCADMGGVCQKYCTNDRQDIGIYDCPQLGGVADAQETCCAPITSTSTTTTAISTQTQTGPAS